MPTYTLIVTKADGRQAQSITTFDSDFHAIRDAATLLSEEVPSVAVAKGVGDDLQFLGAWDVEDGSQRWTADE